MKKTVRCPECIGSGELYDPELDSATICTKCKGEKTIDIYGDEEEQFENVMNEFGLESFEEGEIDS